MAAFTQYLNVIWFAYESCSLGAHAHLMTEQEPVMKNSRQNLILYQFIFQKIPSDGREHFLLLTWEIKKKKKTTKLLQLKKNTVKPWKGNFVKAQRHDLIGEPLSNKLTIQRVSLCSRYNKNKPTKEAACVSLSMLLGTWFSGWYWQ